MMARTGRNAFELTSAKVEFRLLLLRVLLQVWAEWSARIQVNECFFFKQNVIFRLHELLCFCKCGLTGVQRYRWIVFFPSFYISIFMNTTRSNLYYVDKMIDFIYLILLHDTWTRVYVFLIIYGYSINIIYKTLLK